MAFGDLTLRDNAAADKTFTARQMSGQLVERIDTSTTAQEPRTCTINHRRVGQKGTPAERDEHLVQLKVSKKDTDGKLYTGYINVTFGVPVSGPLVRADFDHLNSMLKSATNGFLTSSGNLDKLLRGES